MNGGNKGSDAFVSEDWRSCDDDVCELIKTGGSKVRHFFFEVFLEVLILPKQFLMVGFKVIAQLSEGLYEFFKTVRVWKGLCFWSQTLHRFFGFVVVDSRRVLKRLTF